MTNAAETKPESEHVRVRRALVDALHADLVGPFAPDDRERRAGEPTDDELLPLPPSRWYLAGFLAPKAEPPPDVDDEAVDGELAAGDEPQADDAGGVEPPPKRRQRFPASMGLSVFLPPQRGDDAGSIDVVVRYADYVKEPLGDDATDGDGSPARHPRYGWRRIPHGPFNVSVPLDPGVLAGRDGISWAASGLRLRGELRTTNMEGLEPGTRVLSLFLVNERPPRDDDRDLTYVFQTQLTLRSKDGFRPRPNRHGEDVGDPDLATLALQFRDHFEWAVGHNTSVEDPRPDDDGIVRELRTTHVPAYEVRDVKHDEIPGLTTEMKTLSQLDGPGLGRALLPLIDEYGAWIERQRRPRLDRDALETTRDGLMMKAERARTRLRRGIALLEEDADVREGFRLANIAMHVQALQADAAREDRRYAGGKLPAWRPFQLAFVLLNLGAVADPHDENRTVADLIYFPTGGGKTEAYLGLIAFTLILRRLRGRDHPDGGRGVTVILRYTLRLLPSTSSGAPRR